MDGTLVDSELHTEPSIAAVLTEFGVALPELDYTRFYGRQWPTVVAELVAIAPALSAVDDLAWRLHRSFHELCRSQPPVEIPGARNAVARSHALVPTAIVSSAYRESIEATVRELDLDSFVTCIAGAEDYGASKPAPDGFLHAAAAVGVRPENCLVFEDSIAGIEAAKAAGMWAIAITHRSNDPGRIATLADMTIRNYRKLADDFLAQACNG